MTTSELNTLEGQTVLWFLIIFHYLYCTKCKSPDFSQHSFFPWPSTKFPDFSLTFAKSGISLTFPWPLDTLRGLCRQGYSFALATPGGRLSRRYCFADHAVYHSVMHAPGFAAASATPGGSQWHKTMLGQSHHGINSYKGRHKQRNRSKRFPIIYRLCRPTRLHRNWIRHTQEFTGQGYDG